MPYTLDPRAIVAVMGGDVTGRDTCNVPGPGHSKEDRSLSIKIVPGKASGFVMHSFANDDWKMCQDYVRSKLGLENNWQSETRWPVIFTGDSIERRKKFALKIWADCIDPRGTLAE